MVGTAGNDVICAGAGNDSVNGAGGLDVIYAGSGNDRVTGSNPPANVRHPKPTGDRIYGGSGDDTIWGLGGNDGVYAGIGQDVVYGGPGDDNIHGRDLGARPASVPPDGADRLYGDTGNDYLNGGEGDDYLVSGASTSVDWLHGEAGDDVLIGSPGTFANWFSGHEGDDVLLPFPGRLSPLGNHAQGGAGNDVIITMNGMMDFYRAGTDVKLPLSNSCALNVPLVGAAPPPAPFTVKCSLPWPRPVAALSSVFAVTVERTSAGKTTIGGKVGGGLAELKVADWDALRRNNKGALTGDVLLVDLWKSPWFSDMTF